MTTYKLHANPASALLATLRSGFTAARERLAQARWQAATRRALMRLDDSTLHDLGLDRSEIGSVVSEMSSDGEHSRLRVSRQKAP